MATISLTFYIGYLFYLCGGYPSRFLPICMWAICLTYYMDCLSSLLYICCLSSYSYGGCPSYLLSKYVVFLPIRTWAISLTLSPLLSLPYSLPIRTGAVSLTLSPLLSLPYSLSLSLTLFLFIRGLPLLLSLSHSLTLFLFVRGLPPLLFIWAIYSVRIVYLTLLSSYSYGL
jgi:hypothetical protein